MSEEDNGRPREGSSNGFYSWLKDGTWKMPLKFLWIGTILTALLLFRFMDAFLLVFFGWIAREIYIIAVVEPREMQRKT